MARVRVGGEEYKWKKAIERGFSSKIKIYFAGLLSDTVFFQWCL